MIGAKKVVIITLPQVPGRRQGGGRGRVHGDRQGEPAVAAGLLPGQGRLRGEGRRLPGGQVHLQLHPEGHRCQVGNCHQIKYGGVHQ